MSAPLRYRIVPASPQAHLFESTVTVDDPDPAGQRFFLPAWIPGSYLIRDFARHVGRVRAECAGRPVEIVKRDKSTWACAPCDGPLTVVAEVYAWDLSVRGAHLDQTHGFFNGTSVFLLPLGREDRPCRVEILPPPGLEGWRVATALPRDGAAPWGFGAYRAADYQELIDHPVEMGRFDVAGFEACGVPHQVVVTGRHRGDLQRLAADLAPLCEAQIRLFGEPAPFDEYFFLLTVVGEGYGGLEHRASTALIASRDNLPRPGAQGVSDEYRELLGLFSHEYFHAWNVKRIKPAAFSPPDLARENYTRQLWAFEGITSYYDDLMLLRSGRIGPEAWLESLGQTVTRVLRGPGRHRQSLAESSLDAWSKFYRPDENTPNAVVSYYTKGALTALCLDLSIRLQSGGARSLDDVMRALWRRYGADPAGVPEGGVEAVAAEVAGCDLGDFFHRALHGTEDLPLPELLPAFGVGYHLRPAESDSDQGGKAGKGEARAGLGVRVASGAEARLTVVLDGGPAQKAGLAAGDVVLALDGIKVSGGGLEKAVAAWPAGSRLKVHAFRRDELMEFEVELAPAPADTCWLSLENVEGEVLERRAAWMGAPGA